MENIKENNNEITSKKSSHGSFTKARDKYSDMKSSAYSLLIIGIIGIIVMVLDYFDMFFIKINANNSWIFYFAMFTLFSIFIIVGLYTLKSAKKIKSDIFDEETQTDTIITWALDNMTSDSIDEKCISNRNDSIAELNESMTEEESTDTSDDYRFMPFTELPEELKCFDREDVIKNSIRENFNIDDDDYISSIVDEIYPEIFD